jgi:ubiquinone/menaquinone biosynthesis C-methylase UbiE
MLMANKKIVQIYYSERAHDYDRQKSRTWKSKTGFLTKIIDKIVGAVCGSNKEFILEVGVGSGRVALPLMRKAASQFIGLDLSREMLEVAKMKMSAYGQKLSLLVGDAKCLPFREQVFDAVICVSTLHYVAFPEVILKNISMTLKRKGVFVYGDVTMHEQDHRGFLDKLEKAISYAHVRYCRPSEIKKCIENCGISVEEMEVIPYKKSYGALIEDKAQYFNVKPQVLYKKLREASEKEKNLYDIEENQMTLFYTLITGRKRE